MFAPRPLVSNRPPFLSLCLVLATVFIGFAVVGPMLGLTVASFFYDGNLATGILEDSGRPGYFLAVMVVRGTATFVGLIVFPILHITQVEHQPLRPFFPVQPKLGHVMVGVALVTLAFIVALSPIAEWNRQIHFPAFMKAFETWAGEKQAAAAKITTTLTTFESFGQMLLAFVVIALLPAIGEELVFRGMIQRELWRASNNAHVAIWTAAFLFSAMHMEVFGFVPRLLFGALFGYLYYWSDNLWIPILAHLVNNGVVGLYVSQQRDLEDQTAAPWPYVATAWVVVASLLYFVWKHYRRSGLPAR